MEHNELMRELSRIDEMVALRDQAVRQHDEKSQFAARLISGAIDLARKRIRGRVPDVQYTVRRTAETHRVPMHGGPEIPRSTPETDA